tara:strand:- start:142 stop:495 length:354 start_codon:yes stop_codon:yes gene_type:complete
MTPFMRTIMIALLLAFATQSMAGFVINKQKWQDLAAFPGYQNGYALGAYDQFTQRYVGAEAENEVRQQITSCSKNLELTSRDFVDIINNQYTDLENWKTAPYMILLHGLIEVCNIKQ